MACKTFIRRFDPARRLQPEQLFDHLGPPRFSHRLHLHLAFPEKTGETTVQKILFPSTSAASIDPDIPLILKGFSIS